MRTTLNVEEISILREFNDFLRTCERCNKNDKALIKKAFKIAYEAHKGMRRKSGEPYILHPLAVARIVNKEMGLGAKSIIAALLHDVVEDSDYSIDDISALFGPQIASIVDGLTKISGAFDTNSTPQAENFRKILLTLSEDVRVILIKLADRLHNMRTLYSLPREKQMKISAETLYLFAPLAHRMGFYSIKTELEDLSLKYRYPEAYKEIEEKLKQTAPERENYFEEFTAPIIEKLKQNNIKFELTYRQKSIYSIWYKMQTKNVPFEEIYDIFAARIVFDPVENIPEKTQCWNIYSLITDIYTPKPDRIRDWISTPKANGYEALHVTVMGPKGRWVEVQIRSRRMDELAEKGFAAHWKYKSKEVQETEFDKWLKNIRELLQTDHADALEFLDDFKLNLFSNEIFIFTPKGDVIKLPQNATALDFAYEIHTEIGHKAIAAKVNHKLVPLNTILKSGDQVEIITSEKYQNRREWLDKVVSAKAKVAIKNLLKAETINRIELGKKILEEKLEQIHLKPSSRILKKLMLEYEVSNKDELYSKIGSGIIELSDLKKILKKSSSKKWVNYWNLQLPEIQNKTINGAKIKFDLSTPILLKENIQEQKPEYLIAECCKPIPGDDVIGYFDNKKNNIIIHKTKCPNAIKLNSSDAENIVPVKWTTHKVLSFLVQISLSGTDRFGIYHDIIEVISKDLKISIRNVNLSSHDGIWEGKIDIYVHNTQDLNNLIFNLSKIKGVLSVNRVEEFQN